MTFYFFISYTSPCPNYFLFTSPSSRPLFCTSPMYRVALAPFHQNGCYRPYLCFYHTSLLVFRTFSLPPSMTEITLLYLSLVKVDFCSYHGLFSRYFYNTFPLGEHNVLYTSRIKTLLLVLHLGVNVLFTYLRNLYTCYAWAGGTFFQLCCCVSFLVVAEIVLGDTYLPYQ
jgi:hypothetical protein